MKTHIKCDIFNTFQYQYIWIAYLAISIGTWSFTGNVFGAYVVDSLNASAPFLSYVEGINNLGEAVGRTGGKAYVYSASRGKVAVTTPSGTFNPHAINSSGVVVGELSTTAKPYWLAYYVDSFGGHEIGALSNIWPITSLGRDINDAGTIVGKSTFGGSAFHAFIYNPSSGLQDIGTLGGNSSDAYAINNSGQVVGCADIAGSTVSHAYIYTPGFGMHDIGSLGGSSCAQGINSSGQVIGWSYLADNVTIHAFSFTALGGIIDLGTLGGSSSWANGINDHGQIVGSSYIVGDIAMHAFLFTANGGMRDLNTLVPTVWSGLLVGWGRGYDTHPINNLGQILVNPSMFLSPGDIWFNTYSGNPKDVGQMTPDCCQGNPINSGTGNKFQVETDYVGSGPFPLNFTRVYNSQISSDAYFGVGWRLTYDNYRVINSTSSVANILRPDGKMYTFSLIGSVWSSDSDVTDKLLQQTNSSGMTTGWLYTTDRGSVETYDQHGFLTSISSILGLTQTITRTGTGTVITDSFGRRLQLDQSTPWQLSVTTPDSSVYQYHEDVNHNHDFVVFPDGSKRYYVYENSSLPNALTGVIDENLNRFATWTYDIATGKAITSEHGVGIEKVSMGFNLNSTTILDALGTTRTQTFTTIAGTTKSTSITEPSGTGGAVTSTMKTYDTNGNTATLKDFNNNLTQYTYDLTRNLETKRVEGLTSAGVATGATRTISTQWHPDWRLPNVVTAPGAITSNIYNAQPDPFNANLAAKCTSAPVLPNGLPLPLLCKTVVQAITATGTIDASVPNVVTQFSYDTTGHILSSIDSLNQQTIYTYYLDTAFTGVDPLAIGHTVGDLQSVTNAAGQVTQFTKYDKAGRVRQSVDAKGVVTDTTYTPRGWISSVTVTPPGLNARTTNYSYDAVGQLTGVANPDGTNQSYSYDPAHRLTGVTDNRGNSVTYTLDNMGNRTGEQIKDPGGVLQRAISRSFDALNRLQQVSGAAQ